MVLNNTHHSYVLNVYSYYFLIGNDKSKMKSDSKSSSISNPESEGNLIKFLLEINKSY